MADFFMLSLAQMRRIEPFFPLSYGIARVDDRRVISGFIFINREAAGLPWPQRFEKGFPMPQKLL